MEDVKIKTRTGALCTTSLFFAESTRLMGSDFYLILHYPYVDDDRIC